MFQSRIISQKNTGAMEEVVSMVHHGCKLAKDLESNLATMAAGQPSLISRSCDEIIRTFLSVKERVGNSMVDQHGGAFYHHHQTLCSEAGAAPGTDQGLQEWLRSSVTPAVDLFHETKLLAEKRPFEMVAGGGGGGDGHVQRPSMEVSADSSAARGGSSSLRRRRRSDNARIERVQAPRFGNTEIPPDDGYTWRKYGQKEILNSKFPRSYYRCTHQKLYNCPAKKQVQRLDDDPCTFEVTYRCNHTCHLSSTAPSALPSTAGAPPLPEVTQDQKPQTITRQPSSTTLGGWLSMELGAGASGSGGGGGGGTGPSSSSSAAVRYESEGEHQYLNVVNMADAMFNSGSSSSINSIEFLFPSMEDKWQPEDKRN